MGGLAFAVERIRPWEIDPSSPAAITAYISAVVGIIGHLRKQATEMKLVDANMEVKSAKENVVETILDTRDAKETKKEQKL